MKCVLPTAITLTLLAGVAAPCTGQSPDPQAGPFAVSQPTEIVNFTAHMLASNELAPTVVAPGEVGAFGDANVELQVVRDGLGNITSATARFDVTVAGCTPSSNLILAHIHQGGPAINGPVRVDSGLTVPAPIPMAPVGSASFSRSGLTVPLSIAAALIADPAAFYFDVHTALSPQGVARGQLKKTCAASATVLCVNASRFKVEVSWRVPPQGTSGAGIAVPQTTDTGQFYFFTSNNIELVIKVVDGTAFNGKYWVFYGALTNVEYTITVTDTQTGAVKTYFNPFGNLASVADTAAF